MRRLRSIAPVLVLIGLVGAGAPARGDELDALSVRFLQGDLGGTQSVEAPLRDIRVDIWTDKDEDDPLRRGEEFTLNFSTNADLYVVIYKIDVDGLVEVIWPERRYSDGFVYGNHTYSVPRPGQAGRLRVGDVKGVEYIEAIASVYPFDLRALGIDFRFDGSTRSAHGYYIDGDPFLAVNDINYAITGLEQDVDYVVTDWMHLYVEEPVEYARYSCNTCHLDEQGYTQVTPYVDTCTQVEVRVDWGWYRGWYVSFGWYPLYYEPAFYYWDPYWSRPYWYAWYPTPYRWPAYSCYTRPYPVYWWKESGYWKGDYASRWSDRRTRSVPLYDVTGTRSRTTQVTTRDGVARTVAERPVSSRGAGDATSRRVDEDRLVRNSTPPRQVDGRTTRTREGDAGAIRDPGRDGRGSIRSGERSTERIVSKQPAIERGKNGPDSDRGRPSVDAPQSRNSGRTPTTDGRRWTRPRVQSEQQPGTRSQGGSARQRDDRRNGAGSAVDRSGRSSTPSRERSGSVNRSSQGSSRNSSPPQPRVRSGNSGGSRSGGGSAAKPPSRSTPPPKAKPAPRSGGGSSRSRGGGGRG